MSYTTTRTVISSYHSPSPPIKFPTKSTHLTIPQSNLALNDNHSQNNPNLLIFRTKSEHTPKPSYPHYLNLKFTLPISTPKLKNPLINQRIHTSHIHPQIVPYRTNIFEHNYLTTIHILHTRHSFLIPTYVRFRSIKLPSAIPTPEPSPDIILHKKEAITKPAMASPIIFKC